MDVSKRDIWKKMNIVRPIFTVPEEFCIEQKKDLGLELILRERFRRFIVIGKLLPDKVLILLKDRGRDS
jgi:hypothetical protein